MQQSQINKPTSLNMDKAFKQLTEQECFYLLNHERFLNLHNKKGSTVGKDTPTVGNYQACDIEQPQGENYVVGAYRSPITNELYSWHLNSNGVDYILRITNDGCEIVYAGNLGMSADPKHSIEQWRAFLKVDKTCKNQGGKQLIWVNGKSDVYQLDVEASIATDSFNTPFFGLCSNGEEYLKMCVPQPCQCITATYVPLKPQDVGLANHILDGFKFMYQWEYYDGRKSEWSDRSTLYYQDAKGCFDTSEGLPRCMSLRLPIGNPMVEKIHIAYSTDNGSTWAKYDTVHKYKKYNNVQEMWYDRKLSEDITDNGYSEDDCLFEYKFCNDKQCAAIDPKELSRVFNPIPREAQGLIPVKNALGFYNYKMGTCPIDRKEIEKLSIELDCPEVVECADELVDVTIRAVIHNLGHDFNQFIYRLENDSTDKPEYRAMFGGLNDKGFLSSGGHWEDPVGYDQFFDGETRNFIVYIEGTDYFAEMIQKRSGPNFRDITGWGVAYDMGDNGTHRHQRSYIKSGGFYFQEATIKVPKGTRGFLRLASHHAQGNEQHTSTFVLGVINNIKQYRGDRLSSYKKEEEIYFDTCEAVDGKLELLQTFVIEDNAVDSGFAKAATAFYGYIKDSEGRPVEGAIVAPMEGVRAMTDVFHSVTDHNGFWHMYLEPKSNILGTVSPLYQLLSRENSDITFGVLMENDCSGKFHSVKTFAISGSPKKNTGSNQEIDAPEYKDDFYANVKIKVEDCNGNPVSGLRVALSGTKYDTTSVSGVAEWKVRNYQGGGRKLRAVVLDHKGCFKTDCNNVCNPCAPTQTIILPFCFKKTTTVPHVMFEDVTMNTYAAVMNRRGLKAGGRYGLGAVVQGECGRISTVNNITYIDIPKSQEKGRLDFCGLKYTGAEVRFPDWASCLKIVRTSNLNPFELQWVVDDWERMPNQRIKITIQTLNDYNATHLFKTNTVYQYLQGDRVEFVRNGDGKIFTTEKGVLNYPTLSPLHDTDLSGREDEEGADFFNQLVIEDDGRLDGLTKGAVIELQRPKECATEPIYYEICTVIPLEKKIDEQGNPYSALSSPSGTFHTFDTYVVNRQVGDFPPTLFEHHSPSDFTLYRYDDTGKQHIVNEYEDERRYGRNITVNAPNQYNYFGDMVKTFPAPEQGDIVAMGIKDGSIAIAVCEHDSFITQVADDLIRIGADGTARGTSGDAVFTNPQPKLTSSYGCQYPHIGSIYFGDGWTVWCDVNKHTYVRHDYSNAESVSKGRVDSHFRRRCQEMETFNQRVSHKLSNYRFSTGYNQATGAVYITIKALRDSGINNGYKPYEVPNDTIVYYPEINDWGGFVSFTPDMYGNVDLFDDNGCAFITFLHGQPWIHPMIADTYNEFYGVACDMVLSYSINKFAEKIKRPISIEVQDQMMWYVKEVTCEKPNWVSEIPPVRMKKTNDKWNGAFLANKIGRDGLYGDDKGRGYYINVTLVRDNTDGLKYNTTDNTKRVKYSELDLILSKFVLSESSGFTENL